MMIKATPAPAIAPVRPSLIQRSVQIVQDMTQAGVVAGTYHEAVEELHRNMAAFALAQVREAGFERQMREVDPDYVLTVEECTAEVNEETPLAEAYWAGTSLFFRKVFQAAAAAA